eukprot:4767-Pyramimonas_sp.AAC.1
MALLTCHSEVIRHPFSVRALRIDLHQRCDCADAPQSLQRRRRRIGGWVGAPLPRPASCRASSCG